MPGGAVGGNTSRNVDRRSSAARKSTVSMPLKTRRQQREIRHVEAAARAHQPSIGTRCNSSSQGIPPLPTRYMGMVCRIARRRRRSPRRAAPPRWPCAIKMRLFDAGNAPRDVSTPPTHAPANLARRSGSTLAAPAGACMRSANSDEITAAARRIVRARTIAA